MKLAVATIDMIVAAEVTIDTIVATEDTPDFRPPLLFHASQFVDGKSLWSSDSSAFIIHAWASGDPTRANWSVLPNLQQVPPLLTPTSLSSRKAGTPESPDHAMASPSTQADKRRRKKLSLSLSCDDYTYVGADITSPLPLSPELSSSHFHCRCCPR